MRKTGVLAALVFAAGTTIGAANHGALADSISTGVARKGRRGGDSDLISHSSQSGSFFGFALTPARSVA